MVKKSEGGGAPQPKIIMVRPPKFATASVTIVGTAPYLQNRFSSKKIDEMVAKQKGGSSSAKTRRSKPARSFEADYLASMHVSQEGWFGIPATALRNAMIDACRLTEMDMTRAKMCVFVKEQGLDAENLEPLVKIEGEPRMHLDRVKIGMNQTDISARGIFEKWSSTFHISWDDDLFKADDVFNLLARAGRQVGIGAGRPLSKTSGGTGKGTFEIKQG